MALPTSWRLLWRQNRSRFIAFGFWLCLILAYQWYAFSNDLTSVEVIRRLLNIMRVPFVGPLVYVIFYALQPIIFFPSWLLTISGGFIYGIGYGFLYVLIGSNISSIVAYLVGRYFNDGLFRSATAGGIVDRYSKRMRENSFETVLVMRFLFLPYDIVSYLAGFLHIRWLPFLIATILGSIPGTAAFVLAGASIDGDFTGDKLGFDPWTLLWSFLLFSSSILIWRLIKARK